MKGFNQETQEQSPVLKHCSQKQCEGQDHDDRPGGKLSQYSREKGNRKSDEEVVKGKMAQWGQVANTGVLALEGTERGCQTQLCYIFQFFLFHRNWKLNFLWGISRKAIKLANIVWTKQNIRSTHFWSWSLKGSLQCFPGKAVFLNSVTWTHPEIQWL